MLCDFALSHRNKIKKKKTKKEPSCVHGITGKELNISTRDIRDEHSAPKNAFCVQEP